MLKLTQQDARKLSELLTEDILERYDNTKYWDPDIEDTFLRENGYSCCECGQVFDKKRASKTKCKGGCE